MTTINVIILTLAIILNISLALTTDYDVDKYLIINC